MNLGRLEKAFGSDAIGEPNCPDKVGYPVLLGESAIPFCSAKMQISRFSAADCRGMGAICSFRIQIRPHRLQPRTIDARVREPPPFEGVGPYPVDGANDDQS
jgi:hypothetical protein